METWNATPIRKPSTSEFQSCHQSDPDRMRDWTPIHSNTSSHPAKPAGKTATIEFLVLLTLNIDATSSRPQERVTGIINFITGLDPKVDIVFLQEGSRPALQQILQEDRIRRSWFSSERDDRAWGKQSFATMMLMSKARFARDPATTIGNAVLGPLWRMKYPSHFDRDALCCDMFVSSIGEPGPSSPTRIRLINVYLDSLPIKPSHRPQQISVASPSLRAAGRGLVAGGFNPVLEEDTRILESNGLIREGLETTSALLALSDNEGVVSKVWDQLHAMKFSFSTYLSLQWLWRQC
ncbi:Endonuclease/exonuclease/phosphatase [Penicillium sp. IBT 35674x]|nr:Endonuclease/exonuclease/phosphatase [Penicillium sp. IBT 35674x]